MVVLILIVMIIGLGAGEHWINPLMPGDGVDRMILLDLRLPRVLIAFSVGGLLALAGAWFQVLLGNPLAEPYVLGVAGSSAVGAIAGLMLFPHSAVAMSAGAFIGAWVGIIIVMAFAHLGAGRLLLAGVVLAAFWSAVIALMMAVLPERGVMRTMAWMLGDVSRADIPIAGLLLIWAIALACGMWVSRSLDMLLLGERHAMALGMDVPRIRRRLLLLASAVTAVAVATAGTIGFVGLVVPHLTRLLFGSLHRLVIPASAVGGGLLLVLADTGARTLLAPAELPVGVLTAMIGVPLFLWLLVRGR
ncbi:MAG TPA: iron chelate uptake ABC transporter family permease subunit [Mariprofundaceae bacterium]|nr:iron chelate uptake ABC transporter family permease subunit [Mariprofundaceae bacterium]